MIPNTRRPKNTLISSLIHSTSLIKDGILIKVDDLIMTLFVGY